MSRFAEPWIAPRPGLTGTSYFYLKAVGIFDKHSGESSRRIAIFTEDLRALFFKLLDRQFDLVGYEPIMVHSDRAGGFHQLDRGSAGDVHKTEAVTRRAFSYGRSLTAKKLFVEL